MTSGPLGGLAGLLSSQENEAFDLALLLIEARGHATWPVSLERVLTSPAPEAAQYLAQIKAF